MLSPGNLWGLKGVQLLYRMNIPRALVPIANADQNGIKNVRSSILTDGLGCTQSCFIPITTVSGYDEDLACQVPVEEARRGGESKPSTCDTRSCDPIPKCSEHWHCHDYIWRVSSGSAKPICELIAWTVTSRRITPAWEVYFTLEVDISQ